MMVIDLESQSIVDKLIKVIKEGRINISEVTSTSFRFIELFSRVAKRNTKVVKLLINCLEECKSSSNIINIVSALAIVGSGDRSTKTALQQLLNCGKLDDKECYYTAVALQKIDSGNSYALKALEDLLINKCLDDDSCLKIARQIGENDPGNLIASKLLRRFLEKEDLHRHKKRPESTRSLGIINPEYDHWLMSDRRLELARLLGIINPGDPMVAAILLDNLRCNISDYSRASAVHLLGESCIGNEDVIIALIALLDNVGLQDYLCGNIADALGKIAAGKEYVICSLVDLLKQNIFNSTHRYQILKSLKKITTSGTKRNIEPDLLEILRQPSLDWWLRSKILLEFGDILLSQIQLNRLNTFIIDISIVNNYDNFKITLEINHLLHTQLAAPIPQSQNIHQLKTHLLDLILKPHIVIMFQHPNPSKTLITEIAKLHTPKKIQILWLTEAPIPNAFPLNQHNLASAIQEAIDRFTES